MTVSLEQLRLGIVTGTPGVLDDRGRLLINHSFGRLIEEIQRHVPNVRVCLPVLKTFNRGANHLLNLPPESIVALPPMSNVIKAQKYWFQARRVLKSFAQGVDAFFIRLPFQLPGALRRLGKPMVLQVVSNPRAVIGASSDYRGLMRLAARSFAWYSESQSRKLVHEPNTRTLTHGREMWEKLGCRAGRVVVSSCTYRREMQPRVSFQLNDPPRLLFVGYLRPEKGVHTLLDAFDRLRERRPLKLTIVGGSDKQSQYESKIRERISNSPYRGDITLTGMIDYGPELFSYFQSHDAYVLPSLSEGTPRTLIEARAFGCPIVASRVGGIPDSVAEEENGLLFQVGDAADLARQIERILVDETLRKSLSERGFLASSEFCLENFAQKIVDELALATGATGPANSQKSIPA